MGLPAIPAANAGQYGDTRLIFKGLVEMLEGEVQTTV
jgi:hypothetical protein